MEDILVPLAEQHAELAAIVADRSEAELHRPSRCAGWDVADVLVHLTQTDALAIASVQGTFGDLTGGFPGGGGTPPAGSIDEAAALGVAQARGRTAVLARAHWEQSAATLLAALRACDPHARVEWVAGRLSARTLATTRLAECWIHTGDVAAAFGLEVAPTERLRPIARLAWRTLPYAFERAGRPEPGPVGFDLVGPSGARWELGLDVDPPTVIRGAGVELCLVAARRVEPRHTGLVGVGPDADAVLELVRTYA